jgi:LysM repeat protein
MDIIASGIAWPLLAWGVAGALILAGAVAVDARERGQSAALWFMLTLLFPGFGALAYLVLRPAAELASGPTAVLPDRPASMAERPATAPLGAAPGRGSVPAARDLPRADAPGAREPARPETARAEPSGPRDPARPEASAGAGPLPARDPRLTEGGAAAPRPLTPSAPEPARPEPPPARAETPAATHGGTMEWRRGVGVLPAAAPPPAPPVAEPQARPEPRRGGGVPPWVYGAVAALVVLGAAVVALPRLGSPSSPPPATPTAAPSPTAAASLDAAPAPVVAPEAPPARPSTYTVEEGDTLGGIAAQFDTTIQALMEANGIEDADTVLVGQQLTIP